jgi:hypothetical protein
MTTYDAAYPKASEAILPCMAPQESGHERK